MLAAEVSNPPQKGLGLLDISVERNAYGRQVDSFVGEVDSPGLGGKLPAVFIRAPRICRVGPEVETLATRVYTASSLTARRRGRRAHEPGSR